MLAPYHSDKHFSEFLPTRWWQKSTGIDTEQDYVTVNLCIGGYLRNDHRQTASEAENNPSDGLCYNCLENSFR